MKFLLLIVNAPDAWDTMAASQQQQIIDRMNAFGAELDKAGALVTCGGLAPPTTATTVHIASEHQSVSDGPALVARTGDANITGFFIVEADTQGGAVEWAKRLPVIDDSRIEVRHIAQE